MKLAILVVALCAIPVNSIAADLSIIIGGWSHHFVPASDRDGLNQQQGTVGIEFSTPSWGLQLSHMTDSFGCSSNQASLARRWELFAPRSWIKGGLMLGAIAAHRCVDAGQSVQVTTDEYEPVLGNPPTGTSKCVNDPYQYPYLFCLYRLESTQFQPASPKWVYGVLPGAYLQIGDLVDFEMTLVRSPWTGHHLVLYGQFSIKVFSF